MIAPVQIIAARSFVPGRPGQEVFGLKAAVEAVARSKSSALMGFSLSRSIRHSGWFRAAATLTAFNSSRSLITLAHAAASVLVEIGALKSP
jgi:hypothetical protein